MNDVSFRQRNPRLVHLIRNYLAGIVLGMTGLIALLGYIGLEKLYENANQNLERTIRDRYKAEIQHVVETVAATIEATVPGEIGPELSLIQQEAVKRIIRGAKFESSTMKPDVWNGYFFLYDMEGRCIAHGAHPETEGQTLQERKDPGDKLMIQRLRAAAQLPDTAPQIERFVEYTWEKPGEHGKFPKISYVKRLRGDQWWLGAGVYVDDIERTLQAEQDKQRDQKLWAMGMAAFVLLVMLAVAYLVSAGLAKRVTRPIDQLVEGVRRVSLGDYMHPVALANGTEETQVLGNVFNHMQEKIIAQVSELTTALERIRELTSNEWEKVEEERRRIARELHDDIKQKVWNLRTKLDEALMTDEPAAQRCLLNGAIDVIKSMSQAIRAILQNLPPPVLDGLGLLKALRELCEGQAHSAQLALHVDFQHEELRLPPHVEIMVYRIVQEAMMNIVRHAQAHRVDVWLACHDGILEVGVQDDGKGFDVRAAMHHVGKGQGMGLLNMTERVCAIDGEISFECPSTGGTTVTVKIPMLDGDEMRL